MGIGDWGLGVVGWVGGGGGPTPHTPRPTPPPPEG